MINDRIRWAMRMNESSNDYSRLGPIITNRNSAYYNDRAYGAYQVMGRNIPSWTEQALGRRMTPQEFLRDRRAQDQVFDYHFGRAMRQHGGSLQDAASIWHSGQPLSRAQDRSDGYMTTPDYVARYMRFYEQGGRAGQVQPGIASPVRAPEVGGRPSRQQNLAAAATNPSGQQGQTTDTFGTDLQGAMAPVQPETGRDFTFVAVLDQLRQIAEQSGFSQQPQRPAGGPRLARQAQVIPSTTR